MVGSVFVWTADIQLGGSVNSIRTRPLSMFHSAELRKFWNPLQGLPPLYHQKFGHLV